MVISKKGNFNQSTSSPKGKPQEGEWRSQEIWLCRFRQITLLCVPAPFSFYLTRLCPSPVSLSRQRHSSSCPVFSLKRAAGGKDKQSKAPSLRALHRATNRTEIPRNEWAVRNPSGKTYLFPSLPWSSRERQRAILLAAPWSTTSLLLSVCSGKIQEVAHANAMLKNKNLLRSQSWKPANREMQEEDCVTCPRPGRVSNWAHSWTQPSWKPKPSIHTKQKVPKCPDQTGFKPSTRITANTAHQEKDVFLGELFLLARLGVWPSPHQAAAGLLGWGSQGACTAQHTWDINVSHELCPFGFFSFSPRSRVTTRVTLQHQVV